MNMNYLDKKPAYIKARETVDNPVWLAEPEELVSYITSSNVETTLAIILSSEAKREKIMLWFRDVLTAILLTEWDEEQGIERLFDSEGVMNQACYTTFVFEIYADHFSDLFIAGTNTAINSLIDAADDKACLEHEERLDDRAKKMKGFEWTGSGSATGLIELNDARKIITMLSNSLSVKRRLLGEQSRIVTVIE